MKRVFSLTVRHQENLRVGETCYKRLMRDIRVEETTPVLVDVLGRLQRQPGDFLGVPLVAGMLPVPQDSSQPQKLSLTEEGT